jgi:hypothetical protein
MSPFTSLLPLLGLAAALAACSASGTRNGTSTGGSGAGGDTTTSSTTTTTSDDCTVLCATETKACPMTTTACALLCEANKVEVTWCKAEVTAATDCLAKQPAASFQCSAADAGAAGQPSPKAGICATEITAMNDCWYDGPPGGLPDQTPACMGVCNKEMTATPSCYDTNCVSECEASVAAGQKCNGAIAAYVTCAWRQAASAFACDSESPPRSNLTPGYCTFEALLVTTCLQM